MYNCWSETVSFHMFLCFNLQLSLITSSETPTEEALTVRKVHCGCLVPESKVILYTSRKWMYLILLYNNLYLEDIGIILKSEVQS